MLSLRYIQQSCVFCLQVCSTAVRSACVPRLCLETDSTHCQVKQIDKLLVGIHANAHEKIYSESEKYTYTCIHAYSSGNNVQHAKPPYGKH